MSHPLHTPETFGRIYASLMAERHGLYQGDPGRRDPELRRLVKDLEALNRAGYADYYRHHGDLPELRRPPLDDAMLDRAQPHRGLAELYAELRMVGLNIPTETRASRTLEKIVDRAAHRLIENTDLYRAARDRMWTRQMDEAERSSADHGR